MGQQYNQYQQAPYYSQGGYVPQQQQQQQHDEGHGGYQGYGGYQYDFNAEPAAAAHSGAPYTWQQLSVMQYSGPPLDLQYRQPLGGGRQRGRSAAAQKQQPQQRGCARFTGDSAAEQQQEPQEGQKGPSWEQLQPREDAEHCVVCCEPMLDVAVGPCNHQQVCARCCLRLRLCYDDQKCPLCKTVLSEVIVARWRPDMPSFSEAISSKASLWQRRLWARGVLVDDSSALASRPGQLKLSGQLQAMTSMSCPVCDPSGRRPHPTAKALLMHVQQQHRECVCHVCLEAHRLFPLELDVFGGSHELDAHVEAKHPACRFCKVNYFDSEQLYSHMQREHFTCQVCEQQGLHHQYYKHASGLQQHLRDAHYVCEEPECADALIAFSSAEELQRHHHTRHSTRMPRWDPQRARPLVIDFNTRSLEELARPGRQPRRGGSRTSQRSDDARQQQQQQQQMPGRIPRQGLGGGGPSTSAAAAASLQPSVSSGVPQPESQDPGWRMVDDDLGMQEGSSSAVAGPNEAGVPPLAAPHAPRGAWGGARSGSAIAAQPPTAFPSLQAAAGEAGGSGSGTQRALPRLVKQTVKCPCGRRMSHPVLPEGQAAPPLKCDAECQRQKRRLQLADAFGVEDMDRYMSFADRNRTPTWSPHLLLLARTSREWVQGIERELALFITDPVEKRGKLPAMGRDQRAAVHQIAEQYGLATKGTDSAAGRFVEMLKTPGASVPNRLLSHAAAALTDDDVAVLQAQAVGHTLRLVDVSPSANIPHHLREWEGAYSMEPSSGTPDDDGCITVRFHSSAAMKAALTHLGGGIRGLFRVQRGGTGPTTGSSGGAAAVVNGAAVSGRAELGAPAIPAGTATGLDLSSDGWQQTTRRRPSSRTAGGGGMGAAAPGAAAPSSSTLQLMTGGGDPFDEDSDGERAARRATKAAANAGASAVAAAAAASSTDVAASPGGAVAPAGGGSGAAAGDHAGSIGDGDGGSAVGAGAAGGSSAVSQQVVAPTGAAAAAAAAEDWEDMLGDLAVLDDVIMSRLPAGAAAAAPGGSTSNGAVMSAAASSSLKPAVLAAPAGQQRVGMSALKLLGGGKGVPAPPQSVPLKTANIWGALDSDADGDADVAEDEE